MLGCTLVWGSGCVFGPSAIRKTQPRYSESLRRIGDEQLLLNIVRFRYNEPWSQLDVASIAAQFELSGSAGLQPLFGVGATGGSERFLITPFTRFAPNASAAAADRPTITMTPGERPEVVRGLFQPLTLEGLVFLASTSRPPEVIVRPWVERLNGVPNADLSSGPTPV